MKRGPHYDRLLKFAFVVSLLAIAFVIAVAVDVGVPARSSTAAPAAEGPAAWLSGVGSIAGAVVTGAALLIAALTYRGQVRDKHAELEDKRRGEEKKRREHAEATTVIIGPLKTGDLFQSGDKNRRIEVRNDGERAVFGVALVLIGKDRKEIYQEYYESIPPKSSRGFARPTQIISGAYAMFADTANARWKRWHNGDLIEIPHYPTEPGVSQTMPGAES